MNLVNTTAKVRRQDISVDCAALFDILLIALMMTLLGSKFVAATGLGISFGGGGESGLPKMGNPDSAVANSDMNVLSARGDSMLIFDGAIYTIDSFRKSFSRARQACKARDAAYKGRQKSGCPDARRNLRGRQVGGI